MSIVAERFRPDHRVTVRRYHETSHTFMAADDVSADVIAVQTAKTYGQVAGGFTVTTSLKLADYWESVNPDDLVTIELDPGDGSGLKVVMTGLVNRISEALATDRSGRPTRAFRVSGFDLGKILYHHNCAWDIARYDRFFGDEFSARIAKGLQVSGTPARLIRSLVDTYLYLQVPWTRNWLLLDRVDDTDDWQTLDYTLAQHEGQLWQVMKRLANEPWNVLHTETGADKKLHVVLERAPFHEATGRLTREVLLAIPDNHAVAFDLGRDDTERINWLFFDPKLVVFGAHENSLGYLWCEETGLLNYDEDSVFRHGLRSATPTTMFTPLGNKHLEPSGPNDIERAAARGRTLWNWYRRNHEYRSGQLTVKGSPAYQSGEGVTFGDHEYLIEQVAQHYTWGQQYQTILRLTRGQRHG